ncbi:MAG TPA: LysR family transcriptional regulator [Eoetvoesiella sp.]
MNISLRQLRAFVAVAENQSFTKAANVLHSTQSALSVLVKELEEEVGFRLLDRTTRQVVLSDSGLGFYQMAHKLLEEFRSVVREASDIAMLNRGVVRVGATEAAACSLIVPAIAAYHRLKPGIEVRLIITLVPTMFNALRSGEVDYIIGPRFLQDGEFDQTVQFEPLLSSPLRVWLPPGHSLTRKKEVHWEQLLKQDLVISAVDFSNRLMPTVRRHLGDTVVDQLLSESSSTRRKVSNITAGLSMVKAGLGVTFSAEYIRPLAEAFGLKGRPLVDPDLDRLIALYSRRNRTLSPAAANFSEFFRGYLSDAGLSIDPPGLARP